MHAELNVAQTLIFCILNALNPTHDRNVYLLVLYLNELHANSSSPTLCVHTFDVEPRECWESCQLN